MIVVESINHVSLLVSDTQRALRFYCGLLGLQVDVGRPELGFHGAWLKVGDGQIHLLELAGEPRSRDHVHGGRDWHVALNVTGLEAVIQAFEAAGVSYTLSRSGRRALFCRDPDGNAIELVEGVV
ncbi:MAG: VOC family protein [Gammaproteobacteria bacterium]|jgi:glyoxylase I family protein